MEQPHPPDLKRTSAGLRALFPELGDVHPCRSLGSGFNSVAVETANGIIFRIAKNEAAGKRYAKEVRLLPRLARVVPTAVPEPRWYAESAEGFPFGLIGYKRIDGQPLEPEMLATGSEQQLAADLARFLLALHTFPLPEARILGVPGREPGQQRFESLHHNVMPALKASLTAADRRTVSLWWDTFLADERMHQYKPVLCHGDLWCENILVDDRADRVVGVVDFEAAALSDPAQDFAALLHLGQGFANRVIDSYVSAGGQLDRDYLHRIRRIWELRPFYGLEFAVKFNDEAELSDSINKLRTGPILVSEPEET